MKRMVGRRRGRPKDGVVLNAIDCDMRADTRCVRGIECLGQRPQIVAIEATVKKKTTGYQERFVRIARGRYTRYR